MRGFIEGGTTTTPFDMVARNKMRAFTCAWEALWRSDYPQADPLMIKSFA